MIAKHNFAQADINTRMNNISQFTNSIDTIGRQLGVHPAIIKALIAVESSGNPRAGASRTTGAKGLMQVIEQTWKSTIDNFAEVVFKGQPLSAFRDREVNECWADPDLNIVIGTLTLILKAKSLTKLTGKNISTGDPNDAPLLFSSYNAGEYTISSAYKFAVEGGSSNPSIDFLDDTYLRAAINHVVTKFGLGWNIEAKMKEIGEYAGKVLAFLDLYGGHIGSHNSGGSHNTTPTPPPTPTPSYNNNASSNYYSVSQGDTGYVIAGKLNISFSELQEANPGVNWGRLSIGQRLNIPGKTSAVPTPTPTPPPTHNNNYNSHQQASYYTIVQGDTGYVIARKLGVSFTELSNANSDVNWSRLSLGQRLNIPGNSSSSYTTPAYTPPNTQSRTYIVQRGEGLGTIAQKFGISIDALRNANASKLKRWGNVEGFNVGEELTIPS